jgi:hypothetical protein
LLDLEKLAPDMHRLVARRQREAEQVAAACNLGADLLAGLGAGWSELRARIDQASTSWLLADLLEDPSRRMPAPGCPDAYTVLATDGSQIAADRHEVDGCAVLNVGKVTLRYGSAPSAELVAEPQVVIEEDEVNPGRKNPLGTAMPTLSLALRRTMAEIAALGELIREVGAGGAPTVAMVDGSLIQWPLEGEDPDCRDVVMGCVRAALDDAMERRIPVVGYVSRPGSRDVANALRVLRCPHPFARCETYCAEHARPRRRSAPCGEIDLAVDRMLFSRLLGADERSALFGTRSKVEQYYTVHGCEHHRTRFCYLNAGGEIVRLETPAWVAHDAALMDLVHGVCLDQVNKGQGYPRALTEAHELAVVRGPDRARFYDTLEGMLARARLPIAVTRKALAKRTRSL